MSWISKGLDWFEEKTSDLMDSLADRKNKWNDFTGLYAFPMLLILIFGCTVIGWLAINADHTVLESMFFNVSEDEYWSYWKGLIFAIVIYFLIMLSSGKIFYILNRDLHKRQCLDQNDKPINNPRYKYHKNMLWMFIVSLSLGMIATGFCSINTDQIAKAKAKGVKEKIETKVESNDKVNLNSTDRKVVRVNTTFKNDSTILFQSFKSKIKNAAPNNQDKKRKALGQIENHKKLLKNGTPSQKKEAPNSIAVLERKIIRYDSQIEKAISPIRERRDDSLLAYNQRRQQALSVILGYSNTKDSISGSVFKKDLKDLGENIDKAGGVLIGWNIGFNIANIVLSRLLILFYIGANFGKQPTVRKKKASQK